MSRERYNDNLNLNNDGSASFSDDSDEDQQAKGKGKGRSSSKNDKEVKRRSSKACDNCRKSKCKCTRVLDPATNQPVGPCQNCLTVGSECTYLGASRKRGPPKGYIEAIESRLHRMEALLGGLLQNDDPRAQTLLGELIGNEEARDVLTKDLRAASASTTSTAPTKPRKSWKKAAIAADPSPPLTDNSPSGSGATPPIVSHGFTLPPSDQPTLHGLPQDTPRWFTDEELSFGHAGMTGLGGAGAGMGMSPGGFGGGGATSFGGNALGFDPSGATTSSYRDTNGNGFGGAGGTGDSPSSLPGQSPIMSFGIDIPTSSTTSTSMLPPNASSLPRGSLPPPVPGSGGSLSLSLPHTTNPSLLPPTGPETSSPRQRRRLNAQSPLIGTSQLVGSSNPSDLKSMAYNFSSQTNQGLSATSINHTGQSSYSLSADAELSPQGEGEELKGQQPTQMSELADVVGQLSLNENAEVRYHGRSSGLYLISKSARYKDFFWQFPSAGVWPPTDGRVLKTEKEILELTDTEDPLPDRQTQQHLLDLYWSCVHPHFPILYKVSFMRQYRHAMSNPNSTEPSTPAGNGKVPMVLLLAMFALAARYSDLDPTRSDGKYWTAGQEYMEKAKRVLNYDYGSSKLVSVQALLLMAYREIGTGGMSASWLFTGMAIRMSQDLGLFRDVDKWFLPVQRFSHEEKQTRKRVWWGCIILDRYTASYIGRPGTIHERDYDTSFPSEDEPDEHEQWRPLRPDGTDWSMPSKNDAEESPARSLARYPPTKAHTLSCFNASGALAVVINRIIANIYAIRIRVLGQSSETLLSLLDQSLASWYLALPPHLAYNPVSKKVPPPHVLSLHLQFYSALILLHRPFIPGQNSTAAPGSFPSHSICTTSANAIANIVTIFRRTFTLRQCPPFLTYPIFSAAIICVYNASFDEALARPAKIHLAQCMSALKEMELIWGSAIRQWELLHGLVDLRDAELSAELDINNPVTIAEEDDLLRGTKRPADTNDFTTLPPTNFHARPLGRQGGVVGTKTRRRNSSTSQSRSKLGQQGSTASTSTGGAGVFPQGSPSIPENAALPPLSAMGGGVGGGMFSHQVPSVASGLGMSSGIGGIGQEGAHQTYDILSEGGPAMDLSQFRSPPGTSGGVTNFSDLLNSFLSPTETASDLNHLVNRPDLANMPGPAGANGALGHNLFDTAAFSGFPIGAEMTEEWATYLPQAFFSPGQMGQTPGSGEQGGSSVSPESAINHPT